MSEENTRSASSFALYLFYEYFLQAVHFASKKIWANEQSSLKIVRQTLDLRQQRSRIEPANPFLSLPRHNISNALTNICGMVSHALEMANNQN